MRIEEWPPASRQDQLWQGGQVGQVRFARGPIVAEAVARHIGAPRFRPEHVTAAAANSGKRPLGIGEAETLGRRIVAELVATFQAEPTRRVISEPPLARRFGVLPVQRLNA